MKKLSSLRSGVCIINNNKLLIVKESPHTDHPNKWTFPGGHLENNETLIETALRETREEIGVRVNITGIVSIGCISRPKYDATVVIFSATIKKNAKIKVDNEEIVDYRWVSSKDIKNNTFDWRHPILKEIALKSLTKPIIPIDYFQHIIEK